MPETSAQNFMSEPKRLRGLPLCFYGCPRTATMKPKSSEPTISPRSASPVPSTNNYYKSQCPDPETLPDEEDDDLPQADASAPAPHPKAQRTEETEFSGSLSAEFLSQSSSFANTDFGGQRSQRSHSSSTAVICASLNNVHDILSDTTIVGQKLKFPGDDSLIESVHHHHHSQDTSFSSAAALTSQSAPISRFHFLFVYLTVFIVCGWS
jgi:hypothetical protein